MFDELLTKIFGSRNERLIKQYRRQVAAINKLEPAMEALSDAELQAKTQEFRDRIAKGATTDELLTEAFAVVREASKRVLGMRHFDVQLIGGMVLNDGKIAEMRTGEGKTLTATLAVYLNALAGKGVHVVTVNDYLASRDADWMGRLYNWLGLSVGKILSQQDTAVKKEAYAADITYGTNNEFGFDYLRDNMEYDVSARRQRGLYFAIVDEVDSILIDEARTPLIISGPADDNTDLYLRINEIPPLLTRQQEEKGEGDYWVDEKAHQVYISESGHVKLEKILAERGLVGPGESLYSPKNIILMHHLMASLKAHTLFKRDQQYVVQDGEIVIVDEFTGRLMPGRRWSEGIHQAVEAKEGVRIQHENQTMASITFQNYFRMYEKLSGMTGTADTEAYEFQDIYGLETVVIPTHRKMIRIDEQDKVYRTVAEKYQAIVEDVKACHAKGQPVLLGTTSIENSELLSQLLTKEGIEHNVLNAKQHEREAQIVLDAGRPGMVTIATNMAGRGTDIVLGGGINKAVGAIEADETLSAEEKAQRIAEVKSQWQKLHDEVVAAGGLRIIGSERHESRRIDNQLRGRAGRQGDPGSSVFFVSLEDDLMRLFSSDRIASVMDKLGFQEGEMIEHKMISNSIERAQKKVEENNFGIRKRLLEYDDVMNKQRTVVYTKRRHALMGERIGMDIVNMIWDRCAAAIENNADYEECKLDLLQTLAMEAPFTEEEFRNEKKDKLADKTFDVAMANFKRKTERLAQIANPVIKQVYENQGHMYENILIPITDGKRMYNISCNLKAAYESESKEVVKSFEKSILLHVIDESWKENLRELDELKHSVQNASYEQKDPLLIYKLESVTLFDNMVNKINNQTVSILMRGQIPVAEPTEEQQEAARRVEVRQAAPEQRQDMSKYREQKQDLNDPNQQAAAQQDTREAVKREPIRAEKTVGRNDPCPCGSGKKYKNCHGRNS